MRLAPEGFPLIALSAALSALSLIGWTLLRHRAPLYLAVAAGLVALFLTYFFRDPERGVAVDPAAVVAPADGRVVIVREVEEPFYIKGRAVQVSIFMSPLDVHVNRVPVSGRVAYLKYYPGKFLPAFRDKASTDNEQMHLGLETPRGPVLVKQIAGTLARRIVCYPKMGEEVGTGQRMGLIKLGSRLDLFLPAGSRIAARVGDRTKAGVTVVGGL